MPSCPSLGAAWHSPSTTWTMRQAPQVLSLQSHYAWPCHSQPMPLCSSAAAAVCGQHQPTASRCCALPSAHSSTRKRITTAAKAGLSGEGAQGNIQGSSNAAAASTSTTDSLASQINGSTGVTPATSSGNQSATAQSPGSLQNTGKDEELSNLDEEIKRQWAILKQLLSDSPPPGAAQVPSDDPTAAAVQQQGQQQQQQQQEQQGQSLVLPWFAKPWITWAMFVWSWVVLVLQWQPLWQPLRATVVDFWSGMTVAASATLLVPHTPMATRFQMDLMSWMTGDWPKAAIGAACMFSGILPTLVFTRGLLNAGSVVEQAYGSLVMALHVAFAAWGAAAGQLLQGSSAHTITGPAVVCGLYAGMACVLAREHMQLRQAQAKARETPSEASSSTGPSGSSSGGASGAGSGLTPEEEELLQVPIVSHEAIITFVVALALGWFQPMLGIGGVIGGTLGGLVAGLTCFALIGAFRWCMVRVVSTFFLVLGFALRLPFLVVQFVLGLLVTLVAAAQDMIKGFRRM